MFKFKPKTQLSLLSPKSDVQLEVSASVAREYNIYDKVVIQKNFIYKKGYTWEIGRVTKNN